MDFPQADLDLAERLVDDLPPAVVAALSHRRIVGRWPEDMTPEVAERLGTSLLAEGDDAPGDPTPLAEAVVEVMLRRQEVMAATYETVGDHSMARSIREMVAFTRDPGPPAQAWVEDAKSRIVAAEQLQVMAADQRDWRAKLAKLGDFAAKVRAAVEKLPPHLDAHYRGELRAIGKDLVHDLDLGALDDEDVVLTLLIFLQRGGRDDEDEPAPAPEPEPGETVPA